MINNSIITNTEVVNKEIKKSAKVLIKLIWYQTKPSITIFKIVPIPEKYIKKRYSTNTGI